MKGATLHINLGDVESYNGLSRVRVLFAVDEQGRGHVQLWAREDGEDGSLIMLGAGGLAELQRLLAEAQTTIEELIGNGKCKSLATRFQEAR